MTTTRLPTMADQYDGISPLDSRYWAEKFARYLSDNAFTRYKCLVELAAMRVQAQYDLCPQSAVAEMEQAIRQVTTAAVALEENLVTHHDITALINVIQTFLSPEAEPYVHQFATSYDIIDTARAMMLRDVVNELLLPDLRKLMQVLIALARKEAKTAQMGRTHLQHAVPVTFGFLIAEFVERTGDCMENIERATKQLRGKYAGPVGAYNATDLVFSSLGISPTEFEAAVLAQVGLKPGRYSKQIVMPEPVARLLFELSLLAGEIANLAEDLRILQATEIDEVGERFDDGQTGSSAMPFKRNPISSENLLGIFNVIAPKLQTVMNDLITDLQRDLRNSASGRTYMEIPAYVCYMVGRVTKLMEKLYVNHESIERNLVLQKGIYAAEPLKAILARNGRTDAYQLTQKLAMQSRATKVRFQDLIQAEPVIVECLNELSEEQRAMLLDEHNYTGLAEETALSVCAHWESRI